ncbi:DNA repair protein RecO [Alkaliphilus peptidifermentans]|uniref:DNA repair protein RecO n=1 Tax=Alkaliphilus peptidifermentans DSM 18978 TaxID=1120976 RepID=A0A1G5BU94_9FIRM|nr:DNA repair protein RecO [Alkaliphilus peptidifermentans]SCX93604.1 DNA replication and repair protein RecO [Alkaliphilus peptidifermentans DSM 18978]
MLIKTEGFVIKNRKYSENDSLLAIFTRKAGKINAIAKGARKPKSNLLAGIQPFCYSDFVLYKGRNLYTVSQCEPKQIFYTIREDLNRLAYGSYVLELTETVTTEGQTNNRLFNLLGKTLHILAKEDIEINTVIRAFELKFLVYSGYRPSLNSCVSCGSKEIANIRFSFKEGGIICPQCVQTDPFAVKISDVTIKLADYLLHKDIMEIQKLKIHDSLNNQLKKLIKKYIMTHINKYEFKSLEIVDKL